LNSNKIDTNDSGVLSLTRRLHYRKYYFVLVLCYRSADGAFLAYHAYIRINKLRVINTYTQFDSRRLHQYFPVYIQCATPSAEVLYRFVPLIRQGSGMFGLDILLIAKNAGDPNYRRCKRPKHLQ
jgi:hypothetical protein